MKGLIGGMIDLLAHYANLPVNALYEVALSIIPLGLAVTLFLVVQVQRQLSTLDTNVFGMIGGDADGDRQVDEDDLTMDWRSLTERHCQ